MSVETRSVESTLMASQTARGQSRTGSRKGLQETSQIFELAIESSMCGLHIRKNAAEGWNGVHLSLLLALS